MNVDTTACEAVWQAYLRGLPPGHSHHRAKPDAFGFGEGLLADDLAQLVIAGRKRATTSLPIEFTSLNEPFPKPGDLSIILRGDGKPVAIIERTDVKTVEFSSVDETYAAVEGEEDGSLAAWRQAHMEYFTNVCERLGGTSGPTTPVICQVFRVLWPSGTRRVTGE